MTHSGLVRSSPRNATRSKRYGNRAPSAPCFLLLASPHYSGVKRLVSGWLDNQLSGCVTPLANRRTVRSSRVGKVLSSISEVSRAKFGVEIAQVALSRERCIGEGLSFEFRRELVASEAAFVDGEQHLVH